MTLLGDRLRWDWGQYYGAALEVSKRADLGGWAIKYDIKLIGPDLDGFAVVNPVKARSRTSHGGSRVHLECTWNDTTYIVEGQLPDDAGMMTQRLISVAVTQWQEEKPTRNQWCWTLRRKDFLLTRNKDEDITARFIPHEKTLETYSPIEDDPLAHKQYKVLGAPLKYSLTRSLKFWRWSKAVSLKELPAELRIGEVMALLVMCITANL